uniref:Protein TIFY n=1 Tax=Musa acuminata subsp. malaccensis TaxID=214687 RepID=A0A804I168_MUSAM|nr:PREDICTED: protein TIFY 8-like isoform X2 [Musa acuminata subsp. malaccensis]
MAVVMTTGAGGDEQQQQHQNPFFLDFLGMGMSCGGQTPAPDSRSMAGHAEPDAASPSASWQTLGVSSAGQHGIVSATSLLGSERRGMRSSEVFHFHGRKNAISDPEGGNTLPGRKRSHPESVYSGLIDRAFPLSSGSPESPCLIKMFGKEIVSERPDKARDDEIMLSMHRPPRPTSLVLHPPLSSRPDSLSSKLEQSLSRSPGRLLHASCFSKATISSSYVNKDASAVATVISQSSIDDGSRTNIKASGVVSISNPVSMVCEKISTEFLPRPKASHATESETSNAVRRSKAASPGRQMTIFYSGQAHVFDSVHPNKADVILALAGSNGVSWSTTYHSRSSDQSIVNEAKTREEAWTSNLPISVQGDMSHQIAEIPPPSDHSAIRSGGKDVGDEGCA